METRARVATASALRGEQGAARAAGLDGRLARGPVRMGARGRPRTDRPLSRVRAVRCGPRGGRPWAAA